MIRKKRIVKAMMHRPPVWISRRMMNCPKKDHWEKVGTVTRPVTHTADAAVNSASMNRVFTPGAEAAGSIRRKVPQRIETRKPYARILVAEKGFFLNTVLP